MLVAAVAAASTQATLGFSPVAVPAGAPRSGVLALRAQSDGVSRRGMLATFAAGALALPQLAGAEKARTGLSSKFTGDYVGENTCFEFQGCVDRYAPSQRLLILSPRRRPHASWL